MGNRKGDRTVTLLDMLAGLDPRIAELDREIVRRAREEGATCRLMNVPGIQPVTATAMLALSPDVFTRGRDL